MLHAFYFGWLLTFATGSAVLGSCGLLTAVAAALPLAMASPTDNNEGFFSDVRKVGYLRKPKSMHKRFFVLRAASESGPARLEYYENEKKWRHKSGAPTRSIPLESCVNLNKRADSKNKHLVALYT